MVMTQKVKPKVGVSIIHRRMPQHKCFDLVRYFVRVVPCPPYAQGPQIVVGVEVRGIAGA